MALNRLLQYVALLFSQTISYATASSRTVLSSWVEHIVWQIEVAELPQIGLQIDWIFDLVSYMQKNKIATIEPTQKAAEAWREGILEFDQKTLFPMVGCASVESVSLMHWYRPLPGTTDKFLWFATRSWLTIHCTGNVKGKRREQMMYLRGIDNYRKAMDESLEGLISGSNNDFIEHKA
jgi:hypothetical protein